MYFKLMTVCVIIVVNCSFLKVDLVYVLTRTCNPKNIQQNSNSNRVPVVSTKFQPKQFKKVTNNLYDKISLNF